MPRRARFRRSRASTRMLKRLGMEVDRPSGRVSQLHGGETARYGLIVTTGALAAIKSPKRPAHTNGRRTPRTRTATPTAARSLRTQTPGARCSQARSPPNLRAPHHTLLIHLIPFALGAPRSCQQA